MLCKIATYKDVDSSVLIVKLFVFLSEWQWFYLKNNNIRKNNYSLYKCMMEKFIGYKNQPFHVGRKKFFQTQPK